MKGTTRRGLHPAADLAARDALRASEKERAENVMIVDVARNDLGRVARIGSVRVPALCDAERYPSVWQLTSTVEADVDRDVPLSALFRALFPPASITGAPKIRASQIIAELEGVPRGVYCGAIGMIRPGGDATFNVAIRTATDARRRAASQRRRGVTIDSTAAGELRGGARQARRVHRPLDRDPPSSRPFASSAGRRSDSRGISPASPPRPTTSRCPAT